MRWTTLIRRKNIKNHLLTLATRPLITFNKKYSDSRVLPPVAPAIALIVAPVIPADNNKLELRRVLKIN
ncbi:hypothetical protein MKX08_007970 [Trichoderma sp. CBMAI-0020]|nr:hypothetical protein MKX08_007970 [Trichoderma sp. CBMAI-0020]